MAESALRVKADEPHLDDEARLMSDALVNFRG